MAWRASRPRKTVRLVRPLPRTPFSLAFFTRRSSAGSAGVELGQVEAGDFGAAQPGAEDEVHDGPVPQRPGVPVHGGRLSPPRWRRPFSWWKPSIRSSTFLTVRTCAPASARTCGAGSRSGSTFLVGSPWRSSPAGACTVIQENRADRWARWLLTVAGAIAVAVPSRPAVPSAARWSRQAATSRGVTAETRLWPSPVVNQSANLLQVPGDLPGHLVGPYAPNRQVEVPLRPGGEAVVGLAGAPVKIDYLS